MTQKQKDNDAKPRKSAKATHLAPSPAKRKAAAQRTRPIATAKTIRETVIPEAEIRRMAYACWESRGCPIGSPEVDWDNAIQQLNAGGDRQAQR